MDVTLLRRLSRTLVTALALGASHVACAADLTRTYLHAYHNGCTLSAVQLKALRQHTVLLVPGYLGGLYPQAYAEHQRWLASIGVESKKVAITSGDNVQVNGTIIAAAIRDAAKPVLLISHSKGSVDALQALLSEPALRPKVKGWLSLQGAFLGSPVADMLLDDARINPFFSTLILGFFGGTRESALGLTTAASQTYYKKHAAAIASLLREVPTLAFASALDMQPNAKPGAPPATTLEIPYDMMARDGIRSDGLIPLDAAVLPGMDFVKVSGVDHIAPVMPAQRPLDRARMTQALLLTLRAPFSGTAQDARCGTR